MTSAFRESLENSVLRDSCGCAMGARFMVVALAIAAPYYAVLYRHHEISAWSAVWHTFACLFLVTLVGKTFGLVLHRRLSRGVRRRLVPASRP